MRQHKTYVTYKKFGRSVRLGHTQRTKKAPHGRLMENDMDKATLLCGLTAVATTALAGASYFVSRAAKELRGIVRDIMDRGWLR